MKSGAVGGCDLYRMSTGKYTLLVTVVILMVNTRTSLPATFVAVSVTGNVPVMMGVPLMVAPFNARPFVKVEVVNVMGGALLTVIV